MPVVRWGEFGDIVVRQMVQAKPGENLLVLTDTWTDMQIAEACLIAAINAKTNAQLLVIPRMSHTDTRQFNASTAGATPSIAPVEGTINGTVVVDGTMSEPIGRVGAPVALRLEKGVTTAIEGGADADALRSHLESTGDPKAFHLCHFNVGMNPRAKLGYKMMRDEMVMGAVTFGFGDQDPIFEGTVGAAAMHTDVVLTSPAIHLDGTVMCENNRFNPDLGLGGL